METKFVLITDSHLLAGNSKLHNIPIEEVHKIIVAEIKEIEHEIDFILHTGDISDDGSQESYFTAVEIFSALEKPVYWIAGNHDNLKAITGFKNESNINSSKSFSHNGTTFILLNSVVLASDGKNRSRGVLTSSELQFLKDSLEASKSNAVVIALHHPPIKTRTWKDERMLENTKEFFEILNSFDNYKLVLYGHQHHEQETVIDNAKFYSPPSASFQFDRKIKWAFEDSPPGYGIICIKNSNTFECENRFLNMKIEPIYEPTK